MCVHSTRDPDICTLIILNPLVVVLFDTLSLVLLALVLLTVVAMAAFTELPHPSDNGFSPSRSGVHSPCLPPHFVPSGL